MKKVFLSIFAFIFSLGAFAQDNTVAQQAADELSKVYDLSDGQKQEMLVIQQRKVRNLNQIEGLEATDAKKYRHKRRSIQQGTDASIRRMLNDEQMKVYKQRRIDWRKARAERIATLKESGLSTDEIEDTLLKEDF